MRANLSDLAHFSDSAIQPADSLLTKIAAALKPAGLTNKRSISMLSCAQIRPLNP
jgi:hypothetical protein